MQKNDKNADTTNKHRNKAPFTVFLGSLIVVNDQGKRILPFSRQEVLEKAREVLLPGDVPGDLSAVGKTARRLLVEKNAVGRKRKRDLRFVQEDRENEAWLKIERIKACAMKKTGLKVSDSHMVSIAFDKYTHKLDGKHTLKKEHNEMAIYGFPRSVRPPVACAGTGGGKRGKNGGRTDKTATIAAMR